MSEQPVLESEETGSVTIVRWDDPADELTGVARVAAAMVSRGYTHPPRIGFAAPNRTWALQLQQACTTEGLPAVVTREPLGRGVRRASIMDFRTAWTDFDFLFVVGCVEGLIPTAQALADESVLTQQSQAFARLAQAPAEVVLSSFAKMPASLAEHIHVPFHRTKMVDGTPFARVAPTRFIAAMGAARPTTVGGQQFLRNAGLN